jgi:hypothetical protein
MFLSAYHFDGDPAVLVPAHERLVAGFPPDAIDLHICVVRDGGITAFDACPSRAVQEEFSTSPGFRAAVAAAGLPRPRVEPIGDVHTVHVSQAVHQ